MIRRHRAVLAGIGLSLAASTALAADLIAETRQDKGTLPTGFPYQITVPANWNGTVINDLDAVANADEALTRYLLDNGYAYTGTGRHPERMTKHDPLTELDAQIAVLDIFAEKFGKPEKTIQYGCSGGGFVALAMAEKHADRIDGAVSFNARGTGGMAVANTWADLPYTMKALIAPDSDLKVAPVPNDALPAAFDAWKAALEKAQSTPEGRARIALAVAVSQWPTWGTIKKDETQKPDPNDLDALQKAMFKSASDGISNAVNRRQLYDNPAGLASWTSGIDYVEFYTTGADPAQKKIVTQLYEKAGLSGDKGVAEDLAKINAAPKIEGSPEGVRYWLQPGRLLEGKIGVPLLHVHGLGDALLPPHLTAGYAVAVEKAGKNGDYRTAYIDAAGHCSTNVAEAAAAISAVEQRIETGKWGDTSAKGLDAAGQKLGKERPRYVDYTFATPFNRAFYVGSPHPFSQP